MSILLSIFLGGGLGALLRFLISEQTNRLFLSSFPFGTIVVNVLGAFLMGFVVSYFADKVNVSQNGLVTSNLSANDSYNSSSSMNSEGVIDNQITIVATNEKIILPRIEDEP